MADTVVQIRTSADVTRASKAWSGAMKRLSIEDPVLPDKNISQLGHKMFDYFMGCLRSAYHYYGRRRPKRTGGSSSPSTIVDDGAPNRQLDMQEQKYTAQRVQAVLARDNSADDIDVDADKLNALDMSEFMAGRVSESVVSACIYGAACRTLVRILWPVWTCACLLYTQAPAADGVSAKYTVRCASAIVGRAVCG
jgi:hypothetical protein